MGAMTTQSDAFPVELDQEDNTLEYYGVCDGAEILMNEIDLEARQKEAERQAQEQMRKVEEQERDATALQAMTRQNQKLY